MKIQLEALGSLLTIDFCGQTMEQSFIDECFNMVIQFEQKYSRFRENTFLYTLNATKQCNTDGELLSLLHIAQEVSNNTEGYFDITLLPILENNGYGIMGSQQKENIGMTYIKIKGKTISLENDIQIDLGGIGKGYIIDRIYDFMHPILEKYIINFGGDIRVKGKHCIGLEDPMRSEKVIAKIWIENESVCTSSGEKRKYNGEHHIINPYEKKSQKDKIIVYTKHPQAVYADSYATALFASPLHKSLEYLENIPNLDGMIIDTDGEIYKTLDFNCEFC